jgi:hypothetical protein
VWAHPDLLPTADDFDDPDGFVRGRPEFNISDLEPADKEDADEGEPREPGEPGEKSPDEPGEPGEPGTVS